jgi:hypothetical protein
MLTIRQSQIEHFEQDARGVLEARLLYLVKQVYDFEADDSELHALIPAAINKAESASILEESDIYEFVLVCLELGLDLDDSPECPWAREILADPALTGHQKVQQLGAILDEVISTRAPEDEPSPSLAVKESP